MSTLTTSSITHTFNILQETAPSDCPPHVPHAAVCVWHQLAAEVKNVLRETPAFALRQQTSMSEDVRCVILKFWDLTWHVITTVDPPAKWTQRNNVRLHLALRQHAACKATVSLGQINFTRIVNDVLYGCMENNSRPITFARNVINNCSRCWRDNHEGIVGVGDSVKEV